MHSRLSLGFAATALVVLALSACSAPTPPPAETTAPTSAASQTPEPSEAPANPDLIVADSSLGSIVVAPSGLTVYVYDRDTAGSGASTCSGNCLAVWPAVHPVSTGDPVVDGITGDVGVITGTDGKPQLTLNGLPLYYFADDKAAGDVTGQAHGGIWWVVGPDGNKIG